MPWIPKLRKIDEYRILKNFISSVFDIQKNYPFLRRIFLGNNAEFPPLVGRRPFLSVFTCAFSIAGQPTFRLQEEVVDTKSEKNKQQPRTANTFFMNVCVILAIQVRNYFPIKRRT